MISTMFSNFQIWLHLHLHITLTLLYFTYYFKQLLLMLHLQNNILVRWLIPPLPYEIET